MSVLSSRNTIVTLVLIVVGVSFILSGTYISEEPGRTLDWGRFLVNLGLYIAVVVALQWYYDNHTKQQLVIEVAQSAMSNANVASSGINDFCENTRNIRYEEILSKSEDIIIGFLYDKRIIQDHYSELRKRTLQGKNTSVLLVDPDGKAVNFLYENNIRSESIISDIKDNITMINQINAEQNLKKPIELKCHDLVLRYSFVCSREGIWIKMISNNPGRINAPGIYVRSGSPLYEFYKSDIEELWGKATNVPA